MLPRLAVAEEPVLETLRLDYFHTGNVSEEYFSLDRLVVEPLPWPGNPDRPVDDLDLGKYLFEVRDPESGEMLYSRGFASIYGEWETTGEAREVHRTFHESLRFPKPAAPVRVTLKKRDQANAFGDVWTVDVDPGDIFVDPSHPPKVELIEIQRQGDPAHKVDLLLLGDGYTAAECPEFERQARRLTASLFEVSPFIERRDDFNVWGLCPPARESGVSRPSTGIHRRSPVGATYDAFRSERYVLTFENRIFRDVASWAPYDFVEILVNNETYGGGGIFGLFSTAAAGSEWAEYLFLHEFGHHFAGLADEYYTSSVAYEIPEERVEPWEVNATVHPEELKWKDLVAEDTPVPSPWPKAEFEEHAREIQQRRRRIRAEGRPEAEMSALFHEQRAFETELLGSATLADRVGAFEGANYAPLGTYRPQIDCVMFSRDEVPFCAVCKRGIEQVIDLYTSR
ncbi:MAG: IgA Peptidase M64 [Thermoanaerobaculia bacterium]